MSLTEKLKNSHQHQVVRYGAVGVINTCIDFGLLFLLKSLGLPVEFANICSTGTTFIFSFFANKKYTFKTTDTNVAREIVLFVVVTLFGLWVLQTIVINLTMPLAKQIVGDQNIALLIAKLIATVVSLVWNYVLYNKLVFKKG
jgi:putative flippase GtrA